MHLLQSLFTLACVILIYQISTIIAPSQKLVLTALVTLSPAFIIGQNLMIDIPLLFAWLSFHYILINPNLKSDRIRFILAGIVAGLACLLKYTSLSLIIPFIALVLCKKKHKTLLVAGIPLMIIVIWSIFNYCDYGGIHILERSTTGKNAGQLLSMLWSYLACLGGMMPYSFLFFYGAWQGLGRKRETSFMVLAISIPILTVLIVGLAYHGGLDAETSERFLGMLFFGNGVGILMLLIIRFKKDLPLLLSEEPQKLLNLYLWIFSSSLFIVLFSPFVASRHVLLVIVPITLILARIVIWRFSYLVHALALLVTGLLSLALGLSDRIWAEFYRVNARIIAQELPHKANVYFAGHWGWQWYAKQNRMKQLNALHPQLRPGDYLAYPQGIHQQLLDNIPKQLRLVEVRRYTDSPSIYTFFSTRGSYANFYTSGGSPPWTVTWDRTKPIAVYRVEDAKE